MSDFEACRRAAFRIVHRGAGTTGAALAVTEELLVGEANYEIGVAFLEDVQNLVSHPLDQFFSPREVATRLGPRCAVVWQAIDAFWMRAAQWCEQNDRPFKSSNELLTIQHEELSVLLWTGNRTLPGDRRIGLAGVLRYENAGGEPIPGYSHLAAALDAAGRN